MLLPEPFHWVSYEGYEQDGLAWVTAYVRPDSVCLDVGAHIGIYSLLLAELVGPHGHVYTFEPFESSANLLWRNLEANGVGERVTLIRAAVDEQDGGTVELSVGDSPSEVSFQSHPTRHGRILVPRISLDALAERESLDRVDLIKMDIEGAELRALRGATGMVRRCRPTILLEAHGRPGVEALELLKGHGYEVVSPAGVDIEADPGGITQAVAIPRPAG